MKFFKTVMASVVFASLIGATYAAGTKAFGLTLGETTATQLKKIYPKASKNGTNKWSQGVMYTIPTSSIKFNGLNSVLAIFSANGQLTALSLILSKDRFKDMHGMLSRKYQIVREDIPFVGDSFVRYKSGSDVIEMNAPHLSFEMTLLYAEKSFMDAYNSQSSQETKERSNSEFNQL